MADISEIQKALKSQGIDGWLFYDFHNRDAIAARILKMDTKRFASRRWFYFIPAEGEPTKLVHKIEPWRCNHLPGNKVEYLPWQQQHEALKTILAPHKRIAMQYSPNNAIPYISIVDGGTIELIRSFGVDVVSSANLVSIFESHLTPEDIESHKRAGKVMQMVKDSAFKEIARQLKAGQNPTEYEIHKFMLDIMAENNMVCEDGPIVAVNEHAGDPHFEPTPENSHKIKEGDLILLDLWAKKNEPGAIYYDITWMGYAGDTVPQNIEDIFQVIRSARDTAYNMVKSAFEQNKPIHGWEVDDACREVVVKAGYGEYFIHRTGHNIAEEVHGNGAHIDNLETKDDRRILPGTCFSIEPGIYMPQKFLGFRTELDVYITDAGEAKVEGAVQEKMIPIYTLI
jgi:Xaa-Pro aminopeptidase